MIVLQQVEAELKLCPFVDEICVNGNPYQDYIVALIVPNRRQMEKLAESKGLADHSFEELCDNVEMRSAVLEDLQAAAAARGLIKHEVPFKLKLCKEEWLPENGMLTAAMKLRRKEVENKYAADLEAMYAEPTNVVGRRVTSCIGDAAEGQPPIYAKI